ncbi:MAG: YhbY family RNA-binding protein [Silvanigrellaceae bacterium]|nr:YhbY family RNA-binding protein [Silvanigrellaceae bacterium]
MKKEKIHHFTQQLNSYQKSQLLSLAHHLKPFIQIGNQGIGDTLKLEIKNTLEKHELIKIQLPANSNAQDKENETTLIETCLPENAHIVDRIGRIIIAYLEKDPNNAKIILKNL